MAQEQSFKEGDRVEKVTGDYDFEGEVISVMRKRDGVSVRYAVENDAGIIMIYSAKNLKLFA